MDLKQATETAQKLALWFNRKTMIDPTFRHRGQSIVAIITNATEFEVGYCTSPVNMEDIKTLPRRSRSTPLGRAFF